MKWFLDLLTSSLGKKLVMAFTGLFLILFLTVHLVGNLQLLKDDGGEAFNTYAAFMTSNPLIKVVSYGNYFFIVLHFILAGFLSRKNRQARGTEGYLITGKSSTWSSRNMGILGTIILVFLVIHMKHFWAEMHFGGVDQVTYNGHDVKNLYTLVALWFGKGWYVGLYVFCMVGVGFHLWHGFASAFQTLGINHQKYNPLINFVGKVYAVIVPALFALIPVLMFLKQS